MQRGKKGARACTRRVLTIVVLAACALAAVAGAAVAKRPAHHNRPAHHSRAAHHNRGAHHNRPRVTRRISLTRGSAYLALGDSVTFGFEESNVVPAPNYQDAASFLGYPEQLGAELHVTVANAACPGETSSSLIDATAQSNGCENSPGGGPGYRSTFPLHVNYTGSQLAFALAYLRHHHNVGLVSLMIGANDAFVCQETTADHCASPSELAGVLSTISKNVHTILSAIRNQAHYHGQLAIVNYYSLDYSSDTDNAQSTVLNQTMDAAAQPFNVEVADGFGELQAAAAHSGGSTCKAGLLTQLSTGTCGIHPSFAGQALLAQALEKVIRLG